VGRPARQDGDTATPARLLEAAARAFGARGFEGATLAEIARAAGIRRPSLLYHYETKEALYAAVVQQVFAELGAILGSARDGGDDFAGQLERVVDRLVELVRRRPDAARLVLRELLDGRGPGQALLLAAAVPVLDQAERFVRLRGAGRLRADLPVRAALLQVVSAVFVRAAAGPLEAPLWGDEDHARALARTLFLDPPSGVASLLRKEQTA
jgi:AcrR family transcriptional regulator